MGFGHSLSDSDHFEDEALEKRRRRERKERCSRSISVSPPPIFREKYDPEEREAWRAKKVEKQKIEQSHRRTSSRSPPPMFREEYDPVEWIRNDKHTDYRNYMFKGKRVDVFDYSIDKKWYKCRVTEIGTVNNGHVGRVKVHYDGFNPKYDEWLDLDSEHLARIFTHTTRDIPLSDPNSDSDNSDDETHESRPTDSHLPVIGQWRQRFEVEMRLDIYDRSMSAWYQGRVKELGTEDNGYAGKVKVHYDGYVERYDEWLNCNSKYLAPIFKHTQNGNAMAMDPSMVEISGGSDAWEDDLKSDHDEDDHDSEEEDESCS